uniref:hypothetical protein n=1 Tax=Haramonas pauciplastida TaxID=478668 RepID=UPI002114631F|nr:hypothetical protein NQY21_pgp040 [Haramonas pauciplastida]YP_010444168.1 hypothetical protein NQY21_pgp030 [Haramonas pauciplastida]UTE95044.1 hypothetical protein HaraPt_p135 [Haramonas pauciplastida]UTE95054.1 hypothetical protein HaraPt_p145 [Haramonas pauciplastida]
MIVHSNSTTNSTNDIGSPFECPVSSEVLQKVIKWLLSENVISQELFESFLRHSDKIQSMEVLSRIQNSQIREHYELIEELDLHCDTTFDALFGLYAVVQAVKLLKCLFLLSLEEESSTRRLSLICFLLSGFFTTKAIISAHYGFTDRLALLTFLSKVFEEIAQIILTPHVRQLLKSRVSNKITRVKTHLKARIGRLKRVIKCLKNKFRRKRKIKSLKKLFSLRNKDNWLRYLEVQIS